MVIHISEITNMQKYGNYKEQMSRLKKAMDNHFLLEAFLIEVAIIEDRLESLLRHSNAFNPETHRDIGRKLRRIRELQRNKQSWLHKNLSVELLDEIDAFRDKERNRLFHALMKQNLTSEELEQITTRELQIVKTLCSKTTSYKRALERAQKSSKE